MSDAEDFTFCQVAPQVDDDLLRFPRNIPNINSISLEDSNSNIRVTSSGKPVIKDSGSSGYASNKMNDTSPPKFKSNASVAQKSPTGTKDLLNGSEEEKTATKKPTARAKVPFEKGYSQMDWLRVTQTEPDLAGLKGQTNRRPITMAEVRQHKTGAAIWTVLKGRVYNIAPYMKFHPGGLDMIMKAAGKDCTSLFNKYHPWVNAEFLLEKCLVGVLDDSASKS